ncbi:Rrf2 family transcriptional regulator [uncultured Rhodoferax sp.]|uniref:Rrf2 family transcriptional regulator n=1 Tax=uncultured Rhodoferax sp. TaxID=223188 RepID=UPI0025DCAEE1|nr:Rrf2 family transcriptional regulator [uncultured Rhodoferax sp.]
MRLSTRGRFAITALIDLALRENNVPVPLADLALRHSISLSYLEQVFAKLRRSGLVESTRGPGGGYTLGFRGDQISVADIFTAIEENAPEELEAEDQGSAYVLTQDLWRSLHSALLVHMKTITLHSLAQAQKAKGFTAVEKRVIKKKGVAAQPLFRPVETNAPNSVFAWNGVLPVSH